MFGMYNMIGNFYLQFALAKLLIDIFTVIVLVLAIIGLISTIRFFRRRKKEKKT